MENEWASDTDRLCAARRPVVSPAQPGGTRRMFLGPIAYPDLTSEREIRLPANRRSRPGVRDGAPRDPRDIAKGGLPDSPVSRRRNCESAGTTSVGAARKLGLHRDTVARSLAASEPARWGMTAGSRSMTTSFGRSARTFQRTIYRPGELVQCDPWEPRELIPVGYGQHRRRWVVTCEVCCVCRRSRSSGSIATTTRSTRASLVVVLVQLAGRDHRGWRAAGQARAPRPRSRGRTRADGR
jgi:hypothetical protein